MFLMIDNYDSFVYNLRHFLGELGAEVKVVRNDEMTAEDAVSGGYEGIILSPGPCTPNEAGICLDVVRQAPDDLPIFGVCLGHQVIGQAFGGTIERGPKPMHGKLSRVSHDASGMLDGIPNRFEATRYHSLVVQPDSLPNSLIANGQTDDGCIMSVRHVARPIHSVQFHPESIASEHGHKLLGNFLSLATSRRLPNKTPKPLPKRRMFAEEKA
ncbi:MAG: anthranilate synthase component II [Alphaproteobacteria bacterium]